MRLDAPLCDCAEPRLGWRTVGTGAEHGLVVVCRACRIALHVPHDRFRGAVVVDTPGRAVDPAEKTYQAESRWSIKSFWGGGN